MVTSKRCKITVLFGGLKKEIGCEPGSLLVDVLNQNNISIDAPCGGEGLCGKCKIKITGDSLSMPDANECRQIGEKERKEGYRLACKVKVLGDAAVTLEENAAAHILSEGRDYSLDVSPNIFKKAVRLDAPAIHDQRDDLQRLTEALGVEKVQISLPILRRLPDLLRDSGYRVTVVCCGTKIISVEPGDTTHRHYGAAVDIGTTTVVVYLIDLNTGKQIDVVSALNAQKSFGGDVISRIRHTLQVSEGLTRLHEKIISQLNDMVQRLAEKNAIAMENIYSVFIAGNTTMMHLLTALPPKNIASAPFIPVSTQKQLWRAKELGLKINDGCMVGLFPAISGYVGGDIVAAIQSSGMSQRDALSLLIDIGTNGEIALGNKERIICCSTAAGPAFEGAHIRNGVGGIAGAINRVYVENGHLQYTTIADQQPIGICGSGLVDIVSLLIRSGIVDETGRMADQDEIKSASGKQLIHHIVEVDHMPAFMIVPGNEAKNGEPIVITQKDIREVQLAKAAIAAGIKTLIKEAGKNVEDISHIYLAGGFGSYIDQKNAVAIGLLPKQLADKIIVLGNAAGTGAVMSLVSEKCYCDCDRIKALATYVELSTSRPFQDEYINCMYFA